MKSLARFIICATLLSGCVYKEFAELPAGGSDAAAGGTASESNNGTTSPNNGTVGVDGSSNNDTSGSNNGGDPSHCGNARLDPGEICDPCETCPTSLPCSPISQVGDPATCDVECISEPAPDSCSDCTQQPESFCEMTLGPGSVCDPQSGSCVEGMTQTCAENQDCLPWQYCSGNQCQTPSDCYEAAALANNSMAFCAWEVWTSGEGSACTLNDANGTYECQTRPLVCVPGGSNGCDPWQGCVENMCTVPDSCDNANDPDLFCVFETERADAQCMNGTCI